MGDKKYFVLMSEEKTLAKFLQADNQEELPLKQQHAVQPTSA